MFTAAEGGSAMGAAFTLNIQVVFLIISSYSI